MHLYLNIDGVLLNYDSDTRADYSIELIDYITNEFDCYWLTTHCKGDTLPAIEYLTNYFPVETIEKLKTIKPTYWEDLKTEGIDFDKSFIWLDDYPFQAELSVLEHFGVSGSIYKVDFWKNLSNAQILAWNQLALTQAGKSVLGTSAKISGANLFTRLNYWVVYCGGDVMQNPPVLQGVEAPTEAVTTLTPSKFTFELEGEPAGARI